MRPLTAYALVVLFVLGAAGCARPEFPMPMTANEAARYASGPALVAYLGQPDASPAVCDLQAKGDHLVGLSSEARSGLLEGLRSGAVKPDLWRRCVSALAKTLPPGDSAALFDAMAVVYRRMLTDSRLDRDPAFVARLTALHRLYLDRKIGLGPDAKVADPLFRELRAALALPAGKKKLGAVATQFGQELLEAFDLDRGDWKGGPVDAAAMDALAVAGNELTLTRFSERLPVEALRTEARRRIVRIHVALSPFPEVQKAAASLEEVLLKQGHNPVSLKEHPLVRAWFDEPQTPARDVVVRQQVWQRTATLLGRSGDRPDLSVLPEVPLRGTLKAELAGVSRPVGVCGKGSDLDPSPCVAVTDLTVDNPLAHLEKNGAIHLAENLRTDQVLPWASEARFTLPVQVGGALAATISWGLRFERPDILSFIGNYGGGRGPAVAVRVLQPRPDRFRFDAGTQAGTYVAIVEGGELASYQVKSRGGEGSTGAAGSDGSDGSSGGECGSGGNGTDGGPGGPGGPGGDGGDVDVELVCGATPCADMTARLRGVIRSEGGGGGAGGPGGRGGAGGAGGSGRSATTHVDSNGNTVTDDPGCSGGPSGSSGSNGSSGSPGPDGHGGRVTVHVVANGPTGGGAQSAAP